MIFLLIILTLVVPLRQIRAQSTAVTDIGYREAVLFPVSRGQVVKLHVRGISIDEDTYAEPPYPTTLAGVKVEVTYGATYNVALPIYNILVPPYNREDSALITVQMPYDLPWCAPVSFQSSIVCAPPIQAALRVIRDGTAGYGALLTPSVSSVNINNICSRLFGPRSYSQFCSADVTRLDGSLVLTGVSPLARGETVIIHTLGLGETEPAAPLGAAVDQPLPIRNPLDFAITFTFGSGLPVLLANPRDIPNRTDLARPEWIGLRPESPPGLYDVRVKLPEAIPPDAPLLGTGVCHPVIVTLVNSLGSSASTSLCIAK